MKYRVPRFLAAFTAALALLATLGSPGWAQEPGRVTGTVVDGASNRPLAGVQVFIPGTGIGNLTNSAGRYLLINVPPGQHRIQAQLVGYRSGDQTVTVAAGQTATVEFRLSESAIALEEIVVTGAGQATERRKLGNTIGTIDASQLENAPVLTVSEMLSGREPGVVGLPSSGHTGEGARIRIRGNASLFASNEPLIYVDGVRVDRSGGFAGFVSAGGQASPSMLDDINPESIERIEILKGAAAATLFGTEASAGVIQIFTKRGREGPPRWSVELDQGFLDTPTDRIQPLCDFARNQADVDRIQTFWGRSVQPFEPFCVPQALEQFFETGTSRTATVSVTGGGQLVTYFVSGRWSKEEGPLNTEQFLVRSNPNDQVATDENEKRQFTVNMGIFPHPKLRLSLNSFYAETDHSTPSNSNNIFGFWSSALMGHPRLAHEGNTLGQATFATTRENAHELLKQESQHYNGSLGVNYQVAQGLNLDATFGIDFTNSRSSDFFPFGWNVDDFTSFFTTGLRDIGDRNHREITGDVKGIWNAEFGSNWSSALIVGVQGFIAETEEISGEALDFPGPGVEVVGAGADQLIVEDFLEVVNAGVFAQEQVGWRDWAFLTVGGRYDAHSAFGENFDGQFYPKASLSVMPTRALDWESELLSTVRLRAAIGQSGLQPRAFDKFRTFEPQSSVEGPGVAPDQLGNQQLKPEVSTEWEVGAELGILNDRFGVEVTYWDRSVMDALVARQFPVSAGFLRTQVDNIGELAAKGLELSLNGSVVNTQNVSLNLFAQGSWIDEVVVDMGGAPELKTGGAYNRYRNFLKEGFAPGFAFGAKVADVPFPFDFTKGCASGRQVTPPTEAEALAYFSQPRSVDDFEIYPEKCGADFLNSELGKITPDWQGSFGANMQFLRNFQLNALFEYKFGDFFTQDLSGAFRRSNSVIGRNTPDAAEATAILANPASTAAERLDAALVYSRLRGLAPMAGMNEFFRSDFLRFRELSLTWNVPSDLTERFSFSTLSLTGSVRNLKLWVHEDYPGMDPEINILGRCNSGGAASLDCNFLTSSEGWGIPLPRRFAITLRAGF